MRLGDTLRTPRARSLRGAELAQEVARQRLASLRTDHAAGTLVDATTLASAVGIPVVEQQRLAGVARQTVYNARPSRADGFRGVAEPQVALEMLVVLAFEAQPVEQSVLARNLLVPLWRLEPVAQSLASQGLLSGARRDGEVWLTATSQADDVLREHFDDLYLRRPDAFSVYVSVEPNELQEIDRAAAEMMPGDSTTLAPSVAPSVMNGPELAFLVFAPTTRRAIMLADELHTAVREQAGLDPAPMRLANLIAPARWQHEAAGGAPSAVLDRFTDALLETATVPERTIRAFRERFDGSLSEAELAARTVTVASWALRRAVGAPTDPRLIRTGDDAFTELSAARSMPLESSAEPLREKTMQALSLACEHLGPFAGGRLGQMADPDGWPPVVEPITPTAGQLEHMAEVAGYAIGLALQEQIVSVDRALYRVLGY